MSAALSEPDWRGWSDAALDHAYNPRTHVPDYARHTDWRRAASAAALDAMDQAGAAPALDLTYGPHPNQAVTVYPGDPDGPWVVFAHGGAWRAGHRADYAFMVPGLRALGATVALVGYRLSPEATIPEALADVTQALALTARAAGGARRVLCGHSAGAHLIACALGRDPRAAAGWDGALLISGVYDLAPMARTRIVDDVAFTAPIIAGLSPLHAPPKADFPIWLAAGAMETEAFIAMSRLFADRLRASGANAAFSLIPGENHFSVIGQLAGADSALSRMLRALLDPPLHGDTTP